MSKMIPNTNIAMIPTTTHLTTLAFSDSYALELDENPGSAKGFCLGAAGADIGVLLGCNAEPHLSQNLDPSGTRLPQL